MDRWKDRVALVTGASKGIGEAIVKNLVGHGMKVVACARSDDLLKTLSETLDGKILPIKCDLAKEEDVQAMFSTIKEAWGGVDVCINNAGVCIDSWIIDGEPDAWRTMLDVNVMGLCLCTKGAVTSMRDRGVDDGHVININSLGGHRVGKAHFYSATKYAVTALTDGIRWELRGINSRIKVSEISPGLVKTHFHDVTAGSREKALDMYNAGKPLEAEDLAQVVEFLLATPPHVQVHDVLMRHTEQIP